ncbi:MAG TPA: hypothetical protein PLF84_03690 [Bryobacteraceae bacterium]|nr:hypothetical protein [Bryobacterales bacterium]HRJ18114.1 hypothetical protein [Bryobacteraceae bacterium]
MRLVTLMLLLLAVCLPAADPPRIWDDEALKDWATPVAALGVRPGHYSAAEYYAIPGDNLKTYPVYHPNREPKGYWEWLQKQRPEPLVDASKIRSARDWAAAGQRAFEDLDNVFFRTDDPKLIARARDPEAFKDVFLLPDGSIIGNRWVVTEKGVVLGERECALCHVQFTPSGTVAFGGPAGVEPAGATDRNPAGVNLVPLAYTRFFPGDNFLVALWRSYTVPWNPDPRVEALKEKMTHPPGALFVGDPGTFARFHGSPWAQTKVPDLRGIRYSRYIDASGTHRMRGAEDLARYAAFVNGADPMTFGDHQILTPAQRKIRLRYADEVLYAIGMYLMSLDAPKNPNPAPDARSAAGQKVFQREGCISCHVPPDYTSGKLTLAQGYNPPADHPNADDIVRLSVGTDPELAMRTRKGTGFYKIPTLRGVWTRTRLLHDGSVASLEEMFDPARVQPDHVPGGWKGPAGDRRGIPGHPFGLKLTPEEKAALLAFLRTL